MKETEQKDLVKSAYQAWSAGGDIRSRRERYKRYTYGDQWCDMVSDSHGRVMREDELIALSGKRPLINNLIRQLVKAVVGRYRSRAAEEGYYTDALARSNGLAELDSRLLEEFLISGCAVQRLSFEERFGRKGVWVDNVDFRRFFVNRFMDPRGWDIKMAGMLHDMSFAEVVQRFSGGSRNRMDDLRRIFARVGDLGSFAAEAIGEPGGNIEFFCAGRPGDCRVIELWTLDSTVKSRKRDGGSIDLRMGWHCRWFAPDGTMLGEYDSPFEHGSHPFAVKFFPLTDGEVHSFVEDVVDLQRSINRLMVLIDKIMSTTAKGVLLFPDDQRVDGFDWREITERWAQSDGVIPISGRGMHLPQQVMTNPGGSGAYQLLELQMKLFDDISGVNDALLGRSATGAKGAEMLESQLRNATIALSDIFETFGSFREDRNAKASGTVLRKIS